MKTALAILPDALLVAGLVCLTVGLWWWLPSVAMTVLGVLLLAGGLRLGRAEK